MQIQFVVGNWKMYKTQDEMRAFMREFSQIYRASSERTGRWLGLAAPFTLIDAARACCGEFQLPLHIGAQNMHDASSGAFTGEIALEMLRDRGAEFALLGHSERRALFGERDEFINRKVKKALSRDFRALLCVGESQPPAGLEETREILKRQLSECLRDVELPAPGSLLIAYEPSWAIGTGKSADLDHIQRAHEIISDWLQQRFAGQTIPLLYGGSVTLRNAQSIGALARVDGILIGGASLSAGEFSALASL